MYVVDCCNKWLRCEKGYQCLVYNTIWVHCFKNLKWNVNQLFFTSQPITNTRIMFECIIFTQMKGALKVTLMDHIAQFNFHSSTSCHSYPVQPPCNERSWILNWDRPPSPGKQEVRCRLKTSTGLHINCQDSISFLLPHQDWPASQSSSHSSPPVHGLQWRGNPVPSRGIRRGSCQLRWSLHGQQTQSKN